MMMCTVVAMVAAMVAVAMVAVAVTGRVATAGRLPRRDQLR